MRVMGRNDAVLMMGLTVALFVIFSGPVATLLDYVREIEETRGLHLLPALVILATIFSFHQLRKRQEIRVESLSVARAAQEATERAAEMSRLVAFGHALARTMDSESADSIRGVLHAHLPLLAPGRGVCVAHRGGTDAHKPQSHGAARRAHPCGRRAPLRGSDRNRTKGAAVRDTQRGCTRARASRSPRRKAQR